MTQYVDGNYKTFTASGIIYPFRLVKLASVGVVSLAGLTYQPIGASDRYAASGAPVNIKLLTGAGTVKLEAEDAITMGAVVYGRASGCVDDSSANSALKVGIALETATAAGDIIEVLLHFCKT